MARPPAFVVPPPPPQDNDDEHTAVGPSSGGADRKRAKAKRVRSIMSERRDVPPPTRACATIWQASHAPLKEVDESFAHLQMALGYGELINEEELGMLFEGDDFANLAMQTGAVDDDPVDLPPAPLPHGAKLTDTTLRDLSATFSSMSLGIGDGDWAE